MEEMIKNFAATAKKYPDCSRIGLGRKIDQLIKENKDLCGTITRPVKAPPIHQNAEMASDPGAKGQAMVSRHAQFWVLLRSLLWRCCR